MVRRLLLFVTAFFVGLSAVLGFKLHEQNKPALSTDNKSKYPLLAARILSEAKGDVLINFQPLREQIRQYFDSISVTHSFYFEYLFTGSSIRNGDQNELVGASLMKIPIVMDLYKAVETHKLTLDMKVPVQVDPASSSDQQYGNTSKLKPGSQISLRDAAEITLKESDNTAAYTIFQTINTLIAPEDQAINSLDIQTQTKDDGNGTYALIGSKEYTSILRCLYFSCFLNIDDSQTILNYLTEAQDNNRLRSGVPSSITVARKIGSYSNITQSDCGIIYMPKRRYTLCIMLDEDAVSADTHIKELSKLVYDFVKNY